VDGDYKSMTDEERRALLDQWAKEDRESMTPFQRYLFDNGLFDDVIRPELSEDDVILEPADHCSEVGCGDCIGYWKHDGKVSFCTAIITKTMKTAMSRTTIASTSAAGIVWVS